MGELPSAIIENPPLHRRRWVRKLAITIAVVAAALVARKAWHAAWRSDSNKQLEKAQDRARNNVGKGLDAMFDQQLDSDSNALKFDGQLEFASSLDVRDYDCAKGIDAAFAEALGKDVVSVSTSEWIGDAPRLRVVASFTPTDQVFQLPHSNKGYAGLRMSADVNFLGNAFHVDVKPADRVEFSHMRDPVPFDANDDSLVASGLVQGTCQQLGYAILERLTTWKRPVPEKRDPVKECERGFDCRDNAEQVATKDPAAATKMYQSACRDNDEEACLRGADLQLQLAKGHDDHYMAARVLLENACMSELARTCAAAGRVILTPAPGTPESDYEVNEALPFLVRGCDLGDRDACSTTAQVVKHSKFAEAAPLFTGATSARSKTYGSIFALHWGQWTTIDPGQPTLWVTKEPVHPDGDTLVTRFERRALPNGLVIPDNVDVVYAVAHKATGEPCQRCNPSGRLVSIYSMPSIDCVCVLAPTTAAVRRR